MSVTGKDGANPTTRGISVTQLHNTAENGQLFRTIPDTQYGPIRTGGRLKADTPK
jgi:hypothetical protein